MANVTFQPWDTTISTTPPSLTDTLARVAIERGHFRDITEASLQAEIDAAGDDEEDDNEEDEDEDAVAEANGEDAAGKPENRQELFAAKNEMLEKLASAQQEIAMALDFVSLLASAQIPQAATTVSPAVKNLGIPMGSLGMDFWNRMPVDAASQNEEALLAKSIRESQLRDSANDLAAAGERLQENVRKETVFWDEIQTITDRGWSVSRIPRAQGLLGVHFGFNGAAREFAQRDLAALVPGEDGGIALERGVGTKPKALRALVKMGGKIVGTSKLPAIFDEEETGLEAKIRAARDSLFDEELQHEMVRESRELMSMGVSMNRNTLIFPVSDDGRTLELDLISLDEEHSLPLDSLDDSNDMAQAILTAARLLLCQSHRTTLARKSLPPPPMSDKADTEKPVLAILRPLITALQHSASIATLNTYLRNIDTVLGNADIETHTKPATFHLALPPQSTPHISSEDVISVLLQPIKAEAYLSIPAMSTADSFELTMSIETGHTAPIISLQVGEVKYGLGTLDDMLDAADEFIAAELVGRLHAAGPAKGADWELDRREGLLSRVGVSGEDVREVFGMIMEGLGGRLELRRDGRVVAEWGLGNGGGRMTLWEEWTKLTG